MLRAVILGLGVVLVVAAIALAAIGAADPVALPPPVASIVAAELGIVGLLILIGTLLERRYRGRRSAPEAAGWQSTGERFVDPTSGKLVEVRYNQQTGERAYIDVQ